MSKVNRVIMADINDEDPLRVTELEERQRLKQVEDDLLDLQVVFSSTLDTIDTLLTNYEQFGQHMTSQHEGTQGLKEDLLFMAFREKRRDLMGYMTKLDALRAKVQGTSDLASHLKPCRSFSWPLLIGFLQVSSLLDLGNGYSLKTLAEEARADNINMRLLTEKATADAAAVKVLTIVTLVYLPATVVSVSTAVSTVYWHLMHLELFFNVVRQPGGQYFARCI